MPSVIGSMDMWQRIYAAKSEETAQKYLYYSGIFLFLVLLTFSYIGIFFRNSNFLKGVKPELISATIINGIPHIWLPILLIGLLAALMSTADSMLMVLSATWTHDIYKPWKKVQDEKKLLKMGKNSILVIGIIPVFLAWGLPNFMQLLGNALSSLAILTPAILGGLYLRKPKPKAAYLSIKIGFIIMIVAIFLSFFLANSEVVYMAQVFAFIIAVIVFITIQKKNESQINKP